MPVLHMLPHRISAFLCSVLLIFLLHLTLYVTDALYEDQVGKFDWRQHYIGKLKYVYIDPSTSGTQKFVVATEKNVVAAINTRTGSLSWRQVIEKGGQVSAMSSTGELVTVSGDDVFFIRGWDFATGVLNWEKVLPPSSPPSSALTLDVDSNNKEVTVAERHPGSHVVVTVYSLDDGTLKASPNVPAPWMTHDTSCEVIGHKYFMCFDTVSMSVKVMSLGESAAFRDFPVSSMGLSTDNPHSRPQFVQLHLPRKHGDGYYFALKLPGSGYAVFLIGSAGLSLSKLLPNVVHLTATALNDMNVFGAVTQHADVFTVKIYNAQTWEELGEFDGEFTVPPTYGSPECVHLLPFFRKDRTPSYKILVSTEDHGLVLFHQQGKVFWSREEALASVVSAEFIDLPLSETDAKIEQEFGDNDKANILSMFITRITTQIYQLQSLVVAFFATLQGISHQADLLSSQDLTRDKFGFNKVIFMTTSARKLLALDNRNGQIIWTKYISEMNPLNKLGKPHLPIFVQRTTAHYPHPARCTVFGKHRLTGNSIIVSVNPITGALLDKQELPYRIIQVSSLPSPDSEYIRGLVLLDSNLTVHTYPTSAERTLLRHKDTQYIFTASAETGVLTGYSLRPSTESKLQIEEVWKTPLPQDSQTITHVEMRNPLEHVHSQGRVMGDRSVLYRYLNPNLAAVVTEGVDIQKMSSVTVYLVDVVTGVLIYAASHKRARGPIHIVHSENWVVYSYHNEKSRRTEMSAVELYEGATQSNTSAFSSFTSPPSPAVEHQTYIFPGNVEAMDVTVTEKGITSKHILVALPSGAIAELPRALLDPRRPIIPTAEHREEGLIPYLPELPISAEHIINYNQSVSMVAGFAAAASGLESTCLVVAYGLDLFYTRVTPSKTFDILKDDFDHVLISVVLTVLIIVSYISKRLSTRKALRAAWK
ncbi:ER membrane protein complex subunit 1-like [Ornithodoros turicata]|uniref:ER membrane protein complex subunit 1-like n=1 Tax=Ornithodoros turicata TaxID=34597 RepID=UPI00313953E7